MRTRFQEKKGESRVPLLPASRLVSSPADGANCAVYKQPEHRENSRRSDSTAAVATVRAHASSQDPVPVDSDSTGQLPAGPKLAGHCRPPVGASLGMGTLGQRARLPTGPEGLDTAAAPSSEHVVSPCWLVVRCGPACSSAAPYQENPRVQSATCKSSSRLGPGWLPWLLGRGRGVREPVVVGRQTQSRHAQKPVSHHEGVLTSFSFSAPGGWPLAACRGTWCRCTGSTVSQLVLCCVTRSTSTPSEAHGSTASHLV